MPNPDGTTTDEEWAAATEAVKDSLTERLTGHSREAIEFVAASRDLADHIIAGAKGARGAEAFEAWIQVAERYERVQEATLAVLRRVGTLVEEATK